MGVNPRAQPGEALPDLFCSRTYCWPPLRGHVTAAGGGVELRPCCPLPASFLPGGDSVFPCAILGTPAPLGQGLALVNRAPLCGVSALRASIPGAPPAPSHSPRSSPRRVRGSEGTALRAGRGPTRGVGKARDLHGSEKQKTPPATATASEQPSSAALAGDWLKLGRSKKASATEKKAVRLLFRLSQLAGVAPTVQLPFMGGANAHGDLLCIKK